MGSADRTGGRRLGWEAPPRAIARERVAAFVLLCLFLGLALLLVGACNMQGFPPPPPGGGDGQRHPGGPVIVRGAGGNFGPGGPYGGAPGGPGGAGGGDGNTDCLTGSFTCVTTCAMSSPPSGSGSCDHNGALVCPAGYVRLSSCPEAACARRPTFSCCDVTTGAITPPPCGPTGLVGNCDVAMLPVKSYNCIPSGLGVTDCAALDHQPCGLLDQRCQSESSGPCFCERGDAGLIWSCVGFGDPAP